MEESSSAYRAIRIGDPSAWRLVMVMSATGLEAYLRNIEEPTAEVETLFHEEWDASDGDLLGKIETAVYDHPQLLDDFSADIAVTTAQAMWIPSAVVEEREDSGDHIFTTVYAANDEDIMRDYEEDKVCMYTLVPGLQGFLQRTFPGARVSCHQSVLVRRLGGRVEDLPRVYINVRKDEVDLVAFDGHRLLMSVTHEWRAIDDIRYHLFNLLSVYNIEPDSVHVSLSGDKEARKELLTGLRDKVAYVMMTMVPGIASKAGMSLTASLLMRN